MALGRTPKKKAKKGWVTFHTAKKEHMDCEGPRINSDGEASRRYTEWHQRY